MRESVAEILRDWNRWSAELYYPISTVEQRVLEHVDTPCEVVHDQLSSGT